MPNTHNNNISQFFQTSQSAASYSQKYSEYLSSILINFDHKKIGEAIHEIEMARENKQNIYFIGNGGSAATASHFANDLRIGTRCKENPFNAISLCDNNAIITALGNDVGFDNIFLHQLEGIIKKNDLLVAISASGNSPNIIKAVHYSREKGAKIIGFTGFDGGELKTMSDYAIHVKTEAKEYGPVEDAHMFLVHLIGTYLYYKHHQISGS